MGAVSSNQDVARPPTKSIGCLAVPDKSLPSAKVTGGEIEAELHPVQNLTLRANVSVLDTRVGDFPGAPNTCRPAATGVPDQGGFFCDPVTGASGTVPFNAIGKRLPNAAKFSGNIGFDYAIPTNDGTFLLAGNAYHFSGAPAALDNRLFYPECTTFSASLTWTEKSDRFSIRLRGLNLSKEYYYQQIGSSKTLRYRFVRMASLFGAVNVRSTRSCSQK
ncbi:MAG: TonB-dependent receptor [Sphingobium sp.]|uniref:TonB-dependent receptor n=1 Tax=Sphingobium sp. TaxID=1912891 RepID=UPI0029AC0F1D|nr:TonB-dependent receptor [Sphingobium sp.]MDX3911382.1 TonB-dependent receptor [Sphingobium sp.]